MRWRTQVVLIGVLAASSMYAQQQAGSSEALAGKRVHRVLPTPRSAMARGTAARSTAQTMAARSEEPLAQMPAFAVKDLSGKTADIGGLHPTAGHWLLLYRTAHCPPCDKAMAALARSDSPLFKQGASYVIVTKSFDGDSYGMLDALKASYPTLANATWVEDTDGAGFAALKPHGEPVLYALDGNDIGWAVHGTLTNPATLERLASTWLASTSKPRAATGSTKLSASSTLAGKNTPAAAAR